MTARRSAPRRPRRRALNLTTRLAVLFFVITLAALAVIYLYVVPQLASNLRERKLSNLSADARHYSGHVRHALGTTVSSKRLDALVRDAGNSANARVTLWGVAGGQQAQVYAFSDSNGRPRLGPGMAVAARVARAGRPGTGVQDTRAGPVGEAGRPLTVAGQIDYVIVYSEPLGDVEANVALIRRQVLIAGAIAMAFAVLAGYLVARALSQRVKRLERAAEQVAGGDFSHPIPVDSDDELGQLARAFNDMQRQLAQLDSARKRFIATASHELRTPIFSLGGFIELLQDEELDEETRDRFLGQVREQVDRLGKLSVDLLDLSRLEAGSLDLRRETVDLGDVARGVVDEFLPALAEHDSHLELRLARAPVEADCDPARVAQIMRILIDNALTHTPSGTNVVVSTVRQDGLVRLAVRDHGAGIDRAALPLVFEPFYTSDDARGTGLGLTIASELAERMRGRLDVESGPGRTVFTLEMPA